MSLMQRAYSKFRRSVLGARGAKYPSNMTARGIDHAKWEQVQKDHELNYWVHEFPLQVPAGKSPREYHCGHTWPINRSMFKTLTDQFTNAVVVDVGCGPYGSMDYAGARQVIGIDPLSNQYQKHCEVAPDMVLLCAEAERMPLNDDTADVVLSVNVLDHVHHPYEVLEEMYRVCRPGGHLLLATDVDGTPHHPVKILKSHLDAFFKGKRFKEIRFQECGTHLSNDWPEDMEIPLYVFHGVKA